jgi:UDP-N-acetylmuramyl pentapeptide phosphotransferase/UDP-N-acetylglucosamine-1-phosphate transferase
VTFYIVVSLAAFAMSLLGTRLTILALRQRPAAPEIAHLRDRTKPIPRDGGIALVFALLACLMVADINYGVVLALLLLAAISLLDGLIGVPLVVRLLVQVMAVTVPLNMIETPLLADSVPLWLAKFITGAAWIGFTNSFRSMDHADGIAATLMICIGGGLALLTAMVGSYADALFTYGLIAAAAGAGFLWWNWPPARILMNETGSVPIGFLLGYLLLVAAASGYGYAALILAAYCLSDTLITLGRRLLSRAPDAGKVDYYYRIALQNGRRRENVVRAVFGTHILLIFLAIHSAIEPELAHFHLGMAYFIVFILLGWFAHAKAAS